MKKIILLYQKLTFPFIFDSATEANIKLCLIVHPSERGTIKQDSIKYESVENIHYVDIFDNKEEAIKRIIEIQKKENALGMLCFREEAIPFAIAASKAAGLPHFLTVESAINARDKRKMRECFRIKGCNTPNFKNVDNGKTQTDHLLYPLVVKPASGFSSMGVIKIANKKYLNAALEKVSVLNEKRLKGLSRIDDQQYEGILIEEYIDGPEYVVETYSVNKNHYILVIGYKGYPTGPYFEETIYEAPADISNELQQLIVEQVKLSLTALGIENGPCHVELRVRQTDQKPFIVEIGARIGGSGVSNFIVKNTSGIDMFLTAVKHIDGRDIEGELKKVDLENPKGYASNYIIPINTGGIVKHIEGLEKVRNKSDTRCVIEFITTGSLATQYPDFNGYPGFILSAHSTSSAQLEYREFLKRNVYVAYEK